MKIGIFDSGLGGLIIIKAIRRMMPEYDYIYLGDTKRVPYGNRSEETVFEFTKECVDYLFRKENCAIVIIACNTASARALRKIQQEYLPRNFSKRKVLGVLIPTAEEAVRYKRVGVLGTLGTVSSNTFPTEIRKINLQEKKNLSLFHGSRSNLNVFNEPNIACVEKSTNSPSFTRVFQNSAPILVSLVENGENILAKQFILKYLKPLLSRKPEAIVLGCTHYPIFKKEFKKILGKKIKLISQDEIMPKKLKSYLAKHPEIAKKLSKHKNIRILATDLTQNMKKLSKKWFNKDTEPKLVKL